MADREFLEAQQEETRLIIDELLEDGLPEEEEPPGADELPEDGVLEEEPPGPVIPPLTTVVAQELPGVVVVVLGLELFPFAIYAPSEPKL